jgi:hypothetical protein
LSQFKFDINGTAGQIKYDYTCKKSNKQLDCTDRIISAVDYHNSILNLTELPVSCNNDEVLSQFRYLPAGYGGINYSRYVFKCCKSF